MKLKKKVIFGMVAGFFALATVFNMSMLNENSAGDVSLDGIAVMAQAQGSEMIDGDLTWNDIAEAFNSFDNWANGYKYDDYYSSGDTYNNKACDYIHAFCDLLDIAGQPEKDPVTREEIDNCDGQPTMQCVPFI